MARKEKYVCTTFVKFNNHPGWFGDGCVSMFLSPASPRNGFWHKSLGLLSRSLWRRSTTTQRRSAPSRKCSMHCPTAGKKKIQNRIMRFLAEVYDRNGMTKECSWGEEEEGERRGGRWGKGRGLPAMLLDFKPFYQTVTPPPPLLLSLNVIET